ncbi:hypothetical protein DDT54_05145 [Brenneria nigrifluens DSM 30175 = ATCC 13028]|uniref:Uncharacterized protein n=1 Tax=Brenneria nigrifluens DSM 30175 = ATCC 13028 TaxID=1121120 RepID=A0A2U1UUD8_9GAMM|nr:hypothetical protein DDT54_05145 [Brenneria nigrifluens DSM 30175 = ATCC 13028]
MHGGLLELLIDVIPYITALLQGNCGIKIVRFHACRALIIRAAYFLPDKPAPLTVKPVFYAII